MRRVVAVALSLCVCLLLIGCNGGGKFIGTKTADEDSFIIEYSLLDGQESAQMTLSEGDVLNVSIKQMEGKVDVTVGIVGEAPIYEGHGITDFDFSLNINKSGAYLIKVTGHKAGGKVSFAK